MGLFIKKNIAGLVEKAGLVFDQVLELLSELAECVVHLRNHHRELAVLVTE